MEFACGSDDTAHHVVGSIVSMNSTGLTMVAVLRHMQHLGASEMLRPREGKRDFKYNHFDDHFCYDCLFLPQGRGADTPLSSIVPMRLLAIYILHQSETVTLSISQLIGVALGPRSPAETQLRWILRPFSHPRTPSDVEGRILADTNCGRAIARRSSQNAFNLSP